MIRVRYLVMQRTVFKHAMMVVILQHVVLRLTSAVKVVIMGETVRFPAMPQRSVHSHVGENAHYLATILKIALSLVTKGIFH